MGRISTEIIAEVLVSLRTNSNEWSVQLENRNYGTAE